MPPPPRLLLFVAGRDRPRSLGAIARLNEVVAAHTPATRVDIVDVLVDPQAAEEHRVIVTPTLVRLEPEPPIRLMGDLSGVPLDVILRIVAADREPGVPQEQGVG
ncbi:MAG TPA: circadian clock KaiB family protein [Acidimicrobiales bacterium]|nr:circadian clock KaiB family protein [Acidimicrobiales bacterium]